MKTLKNLFLIGGLAGLSLGIFGNAKGQEQTKTDLFDTIYNQNGKIEKIIYKNGEYSGLIKKEIIYNKNGEVYLYKEYERKGAFIKEYTDNPSTGEMEMKIYMEKQEGKDKDLNKSKQTQNKETKFEEMYVLPLEFACEKAEYGNPLYVGNTKDDIFTLVFKKNPSDGLSLARGIFVYNHALATLTELLLKAEINDRDDEKILLNGNWELMNYDKNDTNKLNTFHIKKIKIGNYELPFYFDDRND